jgi:hypothetical protein
MPDFGARSKRSAAVVRVPCMLLLAFSRKLSHGGRSTAVLLATEEIEPASLKGFLVQQNTTLRREPDQAAQ